VAAAVAAALPLVVLLVLRGDASLDVVWEHHGSHFWLVGGVGAAAAVLGLAIGEAAGRRRDPRLSLIALAFVASAAFLGLHALATPGVLIEEANGGFEAATPVGLFIAAGFAAASSRELASATGERVVRARPALTAALLVLVLAWGVVSLAEWPPLNTPIDPEDFHPFLTPLAAVGAVLFAVAALRYARLYGHRRSILLAVTAAAFVALGEAMVVGVFAHNWHLSWWEWHLLMALAFVLVAVEAQTQLRREGGRAGLFDPLALERTLREVREDYRDALEALVDVMSEHEVSGSDEPIRPVTAGLARRFELTERQLEVLERAAEALSADRRQLRRLGGLVEAGRQASVIQTEADLLVGVLAVLDEAFAPDQVRLRLLRDGELDQGADDLDRRALDELAPQDGDEGRALSIPLLVKGRAAGVLRLTAASRPLGERERSIAETVATQLGITLENARLYHQLDTLFRSYMSADVATALLADPDRAKLGGAIEEVSVLMADVVGFTSFSERTDPAEVVSVINRLFGVVVPEIVARGGTVTQFVGDAVVALFGAPAPQEDHAARACEAGLAFQRAAAALRTDNPDCPQFRVGINTGPVLVGNIGSEDLRHFTAMGDTVNTAARLEAAAPHGSVVISGRTREAVGERAEVEPLGELQVKGKSRLVPAYVLRSFS
jgi:class 3 adenylate cyclase